MGSVDLLGDDSIGAVFEATVDATGSRILDYGFSQLVTPAAGGNLHLIVRAAPWIPVEELRVMGEDRAVSKMGP